MVAPWQAVVRKIDDYRWEIPPSYKAGMSVPGLIFASEAMFNHIWEEQPVVAGGTTDSYQPAGPPDTKPEAFHSV